MKSFKIDFKSWFYTNCKRQRKNGAKICGECPFRNFIENQEALIPRQQGGSVAAGEGQVAHSADGHVHESGGDLKLVKVSGFEGPGSYLWKIGGVYYASFQETESSVDVPWHMGEWWKILE